MIAPSNGAAWGDIDNDGDADLYLSVAGESGEPLRNLLYVNQGDGTFSEEGRFGERILKCRIGTLVLVWLSVTTI